MKYLLALLTSLMLSWWINCHLDVINPDAICYLLSAQQMATSGLHAAMHTCGQASWPFYSALIFCLEKYTHLSYMHAAFVWNAIFSAFSVLFFMLIVKELGGSARVITLAGIVILASHQFNSVREYIIRDHGYWACYLASCYYLIRFLKRPQWAWACLWSVSLIVATLFRIEGIIFLGLVPILTSFAPGFSVAQRMRHFCLLNIVSALLFLSALAWVLLMPHVQPIQLGRIAELKNELQNGWQTLISNYQHVRDVFATQILREDAIRDASSIVLVWFSSWYVIYILSSMSVLYLCCTFFAWIYHQRLRQNTPAIFNTHTIIVLLIYLIINIAITTMFLAQRMFLSKRYVLALGLMCMLWVPFVIDYFMQYNANKKRSVRLIGFAILFAATAVSGIVHFGPSKSYIYQAGKWLAQNVPANASLYTNDPQLNFYSQHFGADVFHQQTHPLVWNQYEYVALRTQKHDLSIHALLATSPTKPLHIFSNKRGDQVLIYHLHS